MAKQLLALGLAALCAVPALAAQPPDREVPPPPDDRPDRPRLAPFLPGGPAGVAATGEFVYVVQGGTLYKFNADSLEVLKRTTLPRERPDVRPGDRPRLREGRPGDRPREGRPDDRPRPGRGEDAPPPPPPPPPPRGDDDRDRPERDFPPRVVPVFTPAGPAGVAATGEFVYVVQGGTLYKLNADSLEVVKKAELPRERPDFRPGPRPRPDDRPRPRDDRPRRDDD